MGVVVVFTFFIKCRVERFILYFFGFGAFNGAPEIVCKRKALK